MADSENYCMSFAAKLYRNFIIRNTIIIYFFISNLKNEIRSVKSCIQFKMSNGYGFV